MTANHVYHEDKYDLYVDDLKLEMDFNLSVTIDGQLFKLNMDNNGNIYMCCEDQTYQVNINNKSQLYAELDEYLPMTAQEIDQEFDYNPDKCDITSHINSFEIKINGQLIMLPCTKNGLTPALYEVHMYKDEKLVMASYFNDDFPISLIIEIHVINGVTHIYSRENGEDNLTLYKIKHEAAKLIFTPIKNY